MALVKVTQAFVMEGYTEIKEKLHWWSKPVYVRKLITFRTWVEAICDDSEAKAIIEKKIENKLQYSSYLGWGKNFEGWKSYRKYLISGEYDDYPDGEKIEMRIEYIRDWKMKKIIDELDGNQFAVLCKELGISAEEAMFLYK